MTITAKQYERVKTFDHPHSQTLDNELLYMVMNDLVEVEMGKQCWTQNAVLRAKLTHAGMTAFREYVNKHNLEDAL